MGDEWMTHGPGLSINGRPMTNFAKPAGDRRQTHGGFVGSSSSSWVIHGLVLSTYGRSMRDCWEAHG